MTEVEYTEQAVEHLEELDPQVADRVMNKIDKATKWTEHRLEPLSGYPHYKLRAGDWRIYVSCRLLWAEPYTSKSVMNGTNGYLA